MSKWCVSKLCVGKWYVSKWCVSKWRVCKWCVGKLYVGKWCVSKLCVGKWYVSKLRVSKWCVSKLCVGQWYVSKWGVSKLRVGKWCVGKLYVGKWCVSELWSWRREEEEAGGSPEPKTRARPTQRCGKKCSGQSWLRLISLQKIRTRISCWLRNVFQKCFSQLLHAPSLQHVHQLNVESTWTTTECGIIFLC